MKNNYLILHGSFSNPITANWFSWLFKELDKKEFRVLAPQMPIGVGIQSYESWSKIMKVYLDLGLINEDTIVIAHSSSPAFIIKFLIEHEQKVKKCIFVAGFNNYIVGVEDYDLVNASFYSDDISDIKKFCDEVICIYADNDPYVKYEAAAEFADAVAIKKVVMEGAGHINSEFGFDSFDAILEYLG